MWGGLIDFDNIALTNHTSYPTGPSDDYRYNNANDQLSALMTLFELLVVNNWFPRVTLGALVLGEIWDCHSTWFGVNTLARKRVVLALGCVGREACVAHGALSGRMA